MAKNAIQQISQRAKQIRKASPRKTWKQCIKEASAEYRSRNGIKRVSSVGAGRVSRKKSAPKKARKVKKAKYRQTGTSNKVNDQRVRAKRPGLRRTAHGTTYTERRKNRSDMPGQLTGTAMNEMVLRNLRERNGNLQDGENRLVRLQKHYKSLPKGMAKSMIKRQINDAKKYIRTIRGEIRMLKTNIR